MFVSDEVSPAWITHLRSAPGPDPWTLGFAVVHRDGDRVIGSAAFKGPPDDDGVVEIAYGIAPSYEGRGYATEAAKALGMRARARRRDGDPCAHEAGERRVGTRAGKLRIPPRRRWWTTPRTGWCGAGSGGSAEQAGAGRAQPSSSRPPDLEQLEAPGEGLLAAIRASRHREGLADTRGISPEADRFRCGEAGRRAARAGSELSVAELEPASPGVPAHRRDLARRPGEPCAR